MADLVSLLTRKLGSPERSMALLEKNRELLGVECDPTEAGLVAMSLCSLGVPAEEVSALLSWKEFESFCANIFRSVGYEVRENVRLRKPTVQIDLVAIGPSLVLSVDCKQWRRRTSSSTLAKVARDQHRRNALLRRSLAGSRPIAAVILTLVPQMDRFIGGAAVVPLYSLRSFLSTVDNYVDQLLLS